MDLGLRGKTALITGGSKGIGLAIARGLSDEGCNIILCSRSKDNLISAELGEYSICDVLNESDVSNTIAKYRDVVDILVNNVGGGGRWGTEIPWQTPEKTWMEVYSKNALAAVRFTNGLLPHMISKKWGRVVTISSIYGKEAGGRPWFTMAKSAEISLMKVLSKDVGLVRNGITFNTICPGHISVKGKPDEENLKSFPLGRMGLPEEVANVVVFLCSPKASFVNGACWTVDGGESYSF